ncbi:helix-turn-helix transcriptional regulator [Streptomyces sp. NPDC005329]|uniref:helix-turn-helix domain-containing protein n=1 Tax=Streptomyces sp. NPDC005329 TaxID=3157034 RepID=UPI0033A25D86
MPARAGHFFVSVPDTDELIHIADRVLEKTPVRKIAAELERSPSPLSPPNSTADHAKHSALKDPQAVCWGDMAEELAFTDAEKDQIQKGVQAMVLASRVHRLAELRKRQHTTQVQVAEAMGVTQARVSRIEKGQPERSEVDT